MTDTELAELGVLHEKVETVVSRLESRKTFSINWLREVMQGIAEVRNKPR
jgi:hypothetical protein